MLNLCKIKQIETYDDRYIDSTMNNCANFCKTTAGCLGFGFDSLTNTCFPSKSIVIGEPVDKIFEDEYSPNHVACNKFEAKIQPSKATPFTERRSNAIFICSKKQGIQRTQPQYYFHNNKTMTKIDEGQNIDFITDVDNYEIKPYRWPKFNRKHFNFRNREKKQQKLKNFYKIKNIQNPKGEVIPDKTNTSSFLFPFGYIKIKEIPMVIKNTINKTGKAIKNIVQIPNDTQLNNSNIKPMNINKHFEIYSEFNKGKYLREHNCVKNITHQECLNFCDNNKNCVGTEWNPYFNNNENICCPMKTLGKFEPRKHQHRLGKFYLKKI
jgi:hypothetical protein